MRRLGELACLSTLALLLNSNLLAGAASPQIREELLGEKSADASPSDKEDTLSPDGRHVAWREKRGSQWVVLLDGQPQGAADEVRWLVFSPDSRRLAFAVRRGDDRARLWRVVLDRQEEKYTFGGVAALVFSADSRHFAYMGQEKNTAVAIIDGNRGTEYKVVAGPIKFTKDGQHYAYAAQKGDQWLVVSNGVEGPLYEDISGVRFTPKGNRLIYTAKRRGAWVVMEDGKEITPEVKGGYLLTGVTPHEEKVIAVGFEGKRSDRNLRVVIDGKPGPLVDSIAAPIRFGATDDHYVYAAHRLKNPALKAARAYGQIVIDGKEGRPYEALVESTGSAWLNPSRILLPSAGVRPWFNPRWHGVSTPVMTADGLHIAYAARRGDKEYVLVADGAEGPAFEAIPCGPTYGPDGKLYYVAFDAGRLITIVNEKRVSEFAWKNNSWADYDGCSDLLVWEGGHWAYMTEQGGDQYYSGKTTRAKRRMIVDGQAGEEYDAGAIAAIQTQLTGGAFHFSYEVHENKANNDASFVVLDGQEGKLYDEIGRGSSEFSSDGTVTFVARSGRKFLRVTQSQPNPPTG